MRNGTGWAVVAASAWLAAMIAVPVRAAEATGQLIDLTVKVSEHMAGAAIAPRTLHKKVCLHAGDFDPRAFVTAQSQTSCQIKNYTRQGATITFDELCPAPASVTSHAVFHLTGGPDFSGSMHTAFSADGRAITVDTDYTGKSLGACSYKPPQASD